MPLNFYLGLRIIFGPFEIIKEPIWKRRLDFLKLNPAGDLPVTVDKENTVIVGYGALVEYLDERKIKDL